MAELRGGRDRESSRPESRRAARDRPQDTDVRPPLGQFQAKEASKDGLLGVVRSLNEVCSKPLADIDDVFEVWWPQIQATLADAPSADAVGSDTDRVPVRTDRDVLEEIVSTVRTLATIRSVRPRTSWPQLPELEEGQLPREELGPALLEALGGRSSTFDGKTDALVLVDAPPSQRQIAEALQIARQAGLEKVVIRDDRGLEADINLRPRS